MGAVVGATLNGNTAVLVTVGPDRRVLDRRSAALTEGLPTHPYHHEGSWAVGRYRDSPWSREVSLSEAVALVKTVRAAARQGADRALHTLAAEVADPIDALALRVCAPLPATIEATFRDHRAQTTADSVLYRRALAEAAEARGWRVAWYAKGTVRTEAAAIVDDLDAVLAAMGRAVGPPWRAPHKLAASAALAARS